MTEPTLDPDYALSLRFQARVRCTLEYEMSMQALAETWEMVVEHAPRPDPNIGFLKLVCQGVPKEPAQIPKSFFYVFAHAEDDVWLLYAQVSPEGLAPVPNVLVRIEVIGDD